MKGIKLSRTEALQLRTQAMKTVMGNIQLVDKSTCVFVGEDLSKNIGGSVWLQEGAGDYFILADGKYLTTLMMEFTIALGVLKSIDKNAQVTPANTNPQNLQGQFAKTHETGFDCNAKPDNGKPRSNQFQRHREQVLMTWGNDTLATNEPISFPGSSITVGTSLKDSKGQYLPDGNYSLKNGTNFQITNGLVSNVTIAKATKNPQEQKLSTVDENGINWANFCGLTEDQKQEITRDAKVSNLFNKIKEKFGSVFSVTRDEFEYLTEVEVKGWVLKLGKQKPAKQVHQDATPVQTSNIGKSLLQQALDQKENWSNPMEEEEANRIKINFNR